VEEVEGSSPRRSAVLLFTQPAELRQVRYFKTVLYEERAQVQDELASHCLRLVKLKGRNAKGSIRDRTQQIADKRREEYELDCLIEALRQRFFQAAATPPKRARCFDVEISYRRARGRSAFPTSMARRRSAKVSGRAGCPCLCRRKCRHADPGDRPTAR
jgi:hypothetical protein